jgi:protein strawberry notch
LAFDFDAVLPPVDVPLREQPASRFALRFAALLEEEPSTHFDNRRIAELSREFFGSSAGHARDAYDAAEAGFNIYLERTGLRTDDPAEAIERLLRDQARLPLQSRRDQTQVDFQQFSTPPAEGFLVVQAAAASPGMNVLEPSAGNGNLAVQARISGANVETNEIDPRRRELLTSQGFEPTAFDAERLDNLLSPEKSYHVIVMNPPFSATGGRVRGHRTAFGARHIEQALLRLKPGGRLVAVVGRGMALDRPMFGEWWKEIGNRYRIRANLGMDGREYARFGTTFDHQMIVIDRDGTTSDVSSIVTGAGLSLLAAWERLDELSKENVYGRVCRHCETAGERYSTASVPTGRDARSGPGAGVDRSSRRRLAGGRPAGRGTFDFDRAVDELEPSDSRQRGEREPEHHGNSGTGGAGTSLGTCSAPAVGGDSRSQHARRIDDGVGELDTSAASALVDIEDGAVFAPYRVQKAVVRGALPHPANVVESAAMACVEPPDVTYRHHLPANVIIEGRVSDLQLEDVIYAGQATSTFLPDGSRRGHWNGDGTGIGKGREIYAFIFNELQQGRRKHVHISASHQLCADAERDRSAVGLPLPIIHQAKFKTRDAIPDTGGVLFTTYSMLSTDFAGTQSRFKQLTDWLGADFEGVIAFDEAHLMKNAAATPHGGKATVDQGTLRGNMGITLQRLFPNARVRYFSATGATEARHMAPYERLGLWGAGAPFADFPAFLVAMQRGGVAAMEMLCRDLKSVGTYLSRTISYGPTQLPDGSIVPQSAVEYEPLLHRLTEPERDQYNRIADLWADLLVAFDRAEENAGQRRNGHRYAQFYSAQQRFFLQLMMAYTLPDVIPAIENDLRAGRSVVLSLFNTGEAQSDRKVRDARALGLQLSELDATPREMIVQLIERQFPIYQYQEETDPVTGNVVRVPVKDAAGNPEINRENLRRQQELLDMVADLDFPQNPLDALVGHFGAPAVAEISGRVHRFENGKYVRRRIDGVPRRELNDFETRQFQQGKKRLAVISGAGSTGISVHADVDARNQERRVFYAFQLSWSADQQMQAFGRVHRSNQTSAPVIRLVLLDLAGQKRLVNAVSKRLAALGALTKGERQSLSNDLFRPEDVTDEFGRAALSQLYRKIELGRHADDGIGHDVLARMGILNQEGTAVRENVASNVEQFLNRIMVLHVETQNRIFEVFYEHYLEAVENAKRQGAFDFGVEEIRARNLRRVSEPETLVVDTASGARTMLHEIEGEVDVVRHTFESVAENAKLGFYRNLRSGRIYAVSAHWDTQRSEVLLAAVKGSRRAVERHELQEKYEPVELSEARTWWEEQYAATPATEPHRFHILSGAIFPIYDKIMGSSGIQSLRIARAVLTDGQALVGLSLSPSDVPQVRQRLGISTPLAEASPAEILNLVTGGSVIELDNGWRLATARIAGDKVLELDLNGVPANREELLRYHLSEEIVHFKRRWFVLTDDAPGVLPKLLAHRKPVRDITATECVVDLSA